MLIDVLVFVSVLSLRRKTSSAIPGIPVQKQQGCFIILTQPTDSSLRFKHCDCIQLHDSHSISSHIINRFSDEGRNKRFETIYMVDASHKDTPSQRFSGRGLFV